MRGGNATLAFSSHPDVGQNSDRIQLVSHHWGEALRCAASLTPPLASRSCEISPGQRCCIRAIVSARICHTDVRFSHPWEDSVKFYGTERRLGLRGSADLECRFLTSWILIRISLMHQKRSG